MTSGLRWTARILTTIWATVVMVAFLAAIITHTYDKSLSDEWVSAGLFFLLGFPVVAIIIVAVWDATK